MIPLVRHCNIENTFRSDHVIISMECDSLQQRRGNGLWKFNMSHLKENDYITKVKSVIERTVQQYAVPVYEQSYIRDKIETVEFTINDTLFLYILLVNIRSETVYYSKVKERIRRNAEKVLQNKVQSIESNLHSAPGSDKEELKRVKEELENIRYIKIDGMITRSRSNWHEKGERSSKYFFNLEKQNWVRSLYRFWETMTV